jgi:glucose-6-phosphate isomerase
MCPTRIELRAEPIKLDLSAVFSFEHGFGRADFLQFAPRAEEVRRQLLKTSLGEADEVANSPRRLLDDYKTSRRASLLGQILGAAKRLRAIVDRVVILASQQSIDTEKMLFAACCHPFHNDLSRGQRGGRPKIYFAPVCPDNDQLHGLLEILLSDRAVSAIENSWGLIAIDDGACSGLLVGLFHLCWDALQSASSAEEESERAVVVGSNVSPLAAIAGRIGSPWVASDVTQCRAGQEVFHPGVLLAASVMGMDIVKLLRGAATVRERFATAPPGDNPALDLGAVAYWLRQRRGISDWAVASHAAALKPLVDRFSTARLSAGRQNALLIQLLPQSVRADRLRVTMPVDGKKTVDRFLVDVSASEMQAARELRSSLGQPTAMVRFSAVDEFSVGQLMTMFSITAAAEKQLATSN